ncbi:MAG: TRAP transporter small permease [Rhodoferax sp.]|jgi:TRAP-type C4-dicarboxylate transport system permease small subunit|uniref:TRAP transporter small permease n=1 Tax=Rhodoferax sp. TaxID=50421 RepID=UPI001B4C1388|nr:TRAP transporter small permease [Rhodoferax sp.]MBP9148986.1 TRAP transporter small permease [Rhodoferax sp.]MBP9735161.1 TRAP transporter small permease [Rhodoferax sp.]
MQEPIPGAAPSTATLAFGPLGHLLFKASKLAAIFGGLIFVAIVVMSIISIVGRKLWSAPVPGDVEMLQMAAAFASASFFAYCHMNGGDVKVDFFTAKASPATVHRLEAFGSLLVGLVGALITWRAGVGALAIKEAGETSMILGWPVWIAQMLMLPGFLLMALAGFYMVGIHLRLSTVQSGLNSGVQA